MAKAAKKEKKTSKAKDNGILAIDDVRSKTPDQLKETLLGLKKEQFNARFKKLAGETAKPSLTRATRRNIARVKTVINENRNKAEGANA